MVTPVCSTGDLGKDWQVVEWCAKWGLCSCDTYSPGCFVLPLSGSAVVELKTIAGAGLPGLPQKKKSCTVSHCPPTALHVG